MAAIIAVLGKEKPVAPIMTLPADALETDGVAPEKGDEVEHSFRGTVTKVTGDMVTVKLTALDGQPIEGAPEEEAGESPEEEQSEEESEGEGEPATKGSKNPGNPGPSRGRGRRGPPINIPGLPPAAAAVGSPLAAALGAPRARARAQTAALGAGLRRRARGQPIPLM
jgi:hypothetical protein